MLEDIVIPWERHNIWKIFQKKKPEIMREKNIEAIIAEKFQEWSKMLGLRKQTKNLSRINKSKSIAMKLQNTKGWSNSGCHSDTGDGSLKETTIRLQQISYINNLVCCPCYKQAASWRGRGQEIQGSRTWWGPCQHSQLTARQVGGWAVKWYQPSPSGLSSCPQVEQGGAVLEESRPNYRSMSKRNGCWLC